MWGGKGGGRTCTYRRLFVFSIKSHSFLTLRSASIRLSFPKKSPSLSYNQLLAPGILALIQPRHMRKVLSRRSICSHCRPAAAIPPLPWPHPSSAHAPKPTTTTPTIATHQTTTLLLLVHHVSVRQLLLVLLVLLQGHVAAMLDLLLLERGLTS